MRLELVKRIEYSIVDPVLSFLCDMFQDIEKHPG